MWRSQDSGFTLMELLIALTIVGVLAVIALPTYNSFIQSSRRTDATAGLYDIQARMERYQTNNNTYATATIANIGAPATSLNGYYTFTIVAQAANTYTIRATPVAGTTQADDAGCTTFTLTNTGVRTVTGTATAAQCWE